MSFTSSESLVRSRWGDVAVVSAAQFLGGLATFLVMVAQVLLLQQKGASGIEVSALVIAEALPLVVLGKLVGWLVDRVDSRVLLVVAGLGQALSCVALGFATERNAIIGGVLALSVCTAVTNPTRQALLPGLVVRDDLARASAIGQTAGSIGMMAGPALAGVLVGGVGPQWTSWVGAACFLATVATAFAIRTRRGGARSSVTATEPAGVATPQAPPAVPVRAWRLSDDALLRVCTWGLTGVMMAASAVNVVLVFFVMGTLQSSPEVYGVIDGMWMVGMLVGAWLVGLTVRAMTSDGALAGRAMIAAAAVCAAFVGVGAVHEAWWIVPCYLVGGVANAAINVLCATLLGRRVPAQARGAANAAVGMRVQAGALVGYVLGGVVLTVAAPRSVLLACGIVGLLVAVALLPRVMRAGHVDPARGDGEPVPAA
jgi:MFS family permease